MTLMRAQCPPAGLPSAAYRIWNLRRFCAGIMSDIGHGRLPDWQKRLAESAIGSHSATRRTSAVRSEGHRAAPVHHMVKRYTTARHAPSTPPAGTGTATSSDPAGAAPAAIEPMARLQSSAGTGLVRGSTASNGKAAMPHSSPVRHSVKRPMERRLLPPGAGPAAPRIDQATPFLVAITALFGIALLMFQFRGSVAFAPGSLRRLRVLHRTRSRKASRMPLIDRGGAAFATSGVVRHVQGMPDLAEPIRGWSCAGPVVVDVPSAGGVVGLCGPGTVRSALSTLITRRSHTVIITRECVDTLYGDVAAVSPAVTVTATLDVAIRLVHAELTERIRAAEDGEAARGEMWLFAHADAQQSRLRSLFDEAAGYGIYAVLLGYWPYGLSLALDEDGRVLSAPPQADELTGAYLATLEAGALPGEIPATASSAE
jgi:hypothetical protein